MTYVNQWVIFQAIGKLEFGDLHALGEFLDNVNFPVLCANVNASGEPRLKDSLLRSTVLEVGGLRVGVIGYVSTTVVQTVNPGKVSRLFSLTQFIQAKWWSVGEIGDELSHINAIRPQWKMRPLFSASSCAARPSMLHLIYLRGGRGCLRQQQRRQCDDKYANRIPNPKHMPKYTKAKVLGTQDKQPSAKQLCRAKLLLPLPYKKPCCC